MANGPVVVVGGGTGIGAAVAEALGERAVVWSRRTGVDATDGAAVRAEFGRLKAEQGVPWGLVHAVGDFEERSLLETDDELYEHLLHSNLTSVFRVVREVVPAMAQAGRGRVILFSASGVGRQRAMRRAPIYFAIKEAVVALGRSLAAEVAASGVTVNVIAPGIIWHSHSHAVSQERMTPKVPAGRGGAPSDLVPTVLHLLSDDAAYITGAHVEVDGGLAL